MDKILVIEDDEPLRDTIGMLLERENLTAILAPDAETGLEMALTLKPQLLLLDLCLPRMSGLDLCKELRALRKRTPIIILSAIGDELNKVLLLELGADDYVVKPFAIRELLARIRAVLRRTSNLEGVVRFGDVEVNLELRTITRGGNEVRLTRAEYNLLLFFLQNVDRPLTRDTILSTVWGYDYCPNTRTVDANVVKLRQKLEPNPSTPRHVLTIHGLGYRFLM